MFKLAASDYVNGGIAWYEDGEEGATVGQEGCQSSIDDIKRRLTNAVDPDERTYLAVEVAVAEYVEKLRSQGNGDFVSADYAAWKFETARTQAEALAIAKAAYKAERIRIQATDDAKPWPAWALEAVKNGWKAPKGWKP